MHLPKRSTLLALSLFMSLGLSSEALAEEWVEAPFPGFDATHRTPYMVLKRIVSNDKDAWLLQGNGQTWKWTGTSWVKTGPCCVADISLGADGTLWALSTDTHQLMKWDAANSRWLKTFPTRAMKQIAAVNATTVYGIGASDSAVYSLTGSSWTKHSCCFTKLAAGAQGELWAINATYGILRWNGSQWSQVPGAFVEVSVSDPAHIAARDPNGNAYLFTGSDWHSLQAPAPLKGIARSNTRVWGISNDNRVFISDI